MKLLRLLLLSLSLVAVMAGCAPSGSDTDAEKGGHAEKILGHWQLREVNDGVLYDVRFKPDSTIFQHFQAPDGHERVYDGTYRIKGDTITIAERRNLSVLIISELSDSVMILVRQDSTAALFDRLPEESRQQAGR